MAWMALGACGREMPALSLTPFPPPHENGSQMWTDKKVTTKQRRLCAERVIGRAVGGENGWNGCRRERG